VSARRSTGSTLTLQVRSGGSSATRSGVAALGWIGLGFGLGLAAGFTASLLRGHPTRRISVTGYVPPAPAIGRRAVPEIDLRGQRPEAADAPTAGSRKTPVGASVSGGR
jgi:hypothetical protein